jgi:hypothetical protein
VHGEDLTVGMAGARIAIRSEVPGVVPWLREVLHPAFDETSAESGAVRVVISPARGEEGAIQGRLFPCFALEREVIRLPGQRRGRSLLLEHQTYGTRYTLSPDQVDVRPSRPDGRLRAGAFRVVRELAMVRALATGGRVQLHASGLEWGGRSVIFGGPKGAGKTTVCAHAAACTGANVIANDRVIVSPSGSGWEVCGVPTIVRVRPETVSALPELFRGVPPVEHAVDLTLEETERAVVRHGVVATPRYLSLSPPQFARGLGVRLTARANLSCVAVISVDNDVGQFVARRLSPGEAADARPDLAFGHGTELGRRTVFDRYLDEAGPPPLRPPAAVPLAEAVPWFHVQVGPSFLHSNTAARELLEMLLAGE